MRRALRGEKLASRFELDVREPRNFADVSRENGERFLFDLKRSVRSYLRVLRRMPLWTEDFKEAYDELAKKEKEVLFIWGDSDCTVPYQEAEQELRELFGERNTSCCLLRESGHGLLLEVHLPNHSRPSFWAGFSMLSALESHEEPRSLKDFQTFSMDFQVSKAFEGFRRPVRTCRTRRRWLTTPWPGSEASRSPPGGRAWSALGSPAPCDVQCDA